MISARFDDLRPHRRRSFTLSDPLDVVVARTLDEVVPVLKRCDALVSDGRWVAGFVAYEAAPAFDPALAVLPPVPGLPLAWFAVFDRRHPAMLDPVRPYRLGPWAATVDGEHHRNAVEAIRGHILDGDTYQVNYTFRMNAPFEGDTRSFYADLSRSQSCGYGGYVDTGGHVVASASPELFFEWRSGRITSRPMKGTTARGIDLTSDDERRRWLTSSEKNLAENLMIVDMVRNDLGKVASVGTIRVPELFAAEKYDTVWQLTSTVTARPRPGTTLVDVFAALFPCASITGAPKVATTEIISRLEADPRGVYCGALGFGGPAADGNSQWAFNVAIRTVTIDRARGLAWYGTGGGITYDSDAASEHEEALLKAAVLGRRSADFSLLETMRWEPAAGFVRLERHLRRLRAAARYFDVSVDSASLRESLQRSVSGEEPLRVRLMVDRGGEVKIEHSRLEAEPSAPIRLAVDDRPVDPADPFLHHKTTNRTRYEEAAARYPGADDVILWNPSRRATETTIANLAVRRGDAWCTPPTADGCLAGVLRAEMLEAGDLVERSITLEELAEADGLARFNSVRGWEPAILT